MRIRYYWIFLLIIICSGLITGPGCKKENLVEIPTVRTFEVTGITGNLAKSGGNVLDNGGASVTARGVFWSKSENPGLNNNNGATSDGTGSGEFESSINGLSSGTTYYLRAYAINSEGIGYGDQLQFTTLKLASVTTTEVNNVSYTSAVSGGTVIDDGGAAVTARGIVWDKNIDPTFDENTGKTLDGLGTGEFESNLTELLPGTKYYVRSYAVNAKGTSYGQQVEFITDSDLATITTTEVNNITSNSATSGGTVIDDGGVEVTARGVVWDTSENPTEDNNAGKTLNGSGTGEFESYLTELLPGTKYYVRSYAVNIAGTAYGQQVEFITDSDLATVTTAVVSNITSGSAVSGGNVIEDGGEAVTARGVVWGTSENPTVDNNAAKTLNGQGTGIFSSNLTGLTENTTYYVRAYATSSKGTAYGYQRTFRTLVEDTGYDIPDDAPGPFFVFGFDDAYDSDYYYAYHELKSRGLRGTSFVYTGRIGRPGALTWEMIHEMVNDGWEMGCHSHSHIRLTDATEHQIRNEFETVNSIFKEQGLPIPKHHTYPYGANDENVRRIVSEYRLSGRSSSTPTRNFHLKNFDFMRYGWVHADMQNLSGQHGLNVIKEQVDNAFKERTVIVSFLMHELVETQTGGYQCLITLFVELLDYIIDNGGTIVTQNEAYNIIMEYRQTLDF